MARILGGAPMSGTIGGTTFYQMYGRSYMRAKSSLSGKRVKKSKEFEKTRQCAHSMGRAAKIGSIIYKALPMDYKRERWLFRAITGEAASLLYKGKGEQEVKELLWKRYIKDTDAIPETDKDFLRGQRNHHEANKETNLKLREIFEKRWEKQKLGDYGFKRAWPKRGSFNTSRFREELNLAMRYRLESSWFS